MSEREEFHDSHVGEDSEGEEVIFREGAAAVENATASTAPTASPQMVTKSDLEEVIEGWKSKFHQLSEGVRAIQMASEKFHTQMDNLQRDSCERDGAQERQIQQMQEGLFESPCAPTMSTPITPSGVPSRHRPDFHFVSPVNQSAPTEPARGNGGHDLSQCPTHEDEHRNSGDAQHSPSRNNSSGMNNSASRPSSSPKVPIFDGTVSAQFRPWIIQFEAIARHQCWTLGERIVRLVASLTGPAANMLIGNDGVLGLFCAHCLG